MCDPPLSVGLLTEDCQPEVLPLSPRAARLIMAAADGIRSGDPVRAALIRRLRPTERDYDHPKYSLA